jgi:hypothetical protein
MITRKLGNLMGGCLVLAALSMSMLAHAQGQTPGSRPNDASMETRSAFATAIEHQLRQRGFDARAQLQGDRRDVLHIQWQGVRRSDIYNFVTSSVMRDARQMGFTQIIFTNGQQQWEYNLARESMIWSPAQL